MAVLDITKSDDRPDWRSRCYGDYAFYDDVDGPGAADRLNEKYAKSLALTSAAPSSRILEIGFGTGDFLDWAAKHGHRTAGIEIIPSLVDQVRAKGHDVSLGTIVDYRGPGATFDLIVAFHVFEHLDREELLDTLDAAYHHLRPGGEILIEVPNAASPFSHQLVHGDPTHVSYLTAKAINHLGRVAGLRPHYAGNAPRTLAGGQRSKTAKRLVYLARNIVEAGFASSITTASEHPSAPP